MQVNLRLKMQIIASVESQFEFSSSKMSVCLSIHVNMFLVAVFRKTVYQIPPIFNHNKCTLILCLKLFGNKSILDMNSQWNQHFSIIFFSWHRLYFLQTCNTQHIKNYYRFIYFMHWLTCNDWDRVWETHIE